MEINMNEVIRHVREYDIDMTIVTDSAIIHLVAELWILLLSCPDGYHLSGAYYDRNSGRLYARAVDECFDTSKIFQGEQWILHNRQIHPTIFLFVYYDDLCEFISGNMINDQS